MKRLREPVERRRRGNDRMTAAYIYFGKPMNSDTGAALVHAARCLMGERPNPSVPFSWDEEEFVNQREIRLEIRTSPIEEKLMKSPTSPGPAAEMPIEAEISRLVEQGVPKHLPKIGSDIERFRSSLERLTSSSIDGLEGLTSELQELQKCLKSEVERVQGEIESALAGIKIIVETIAPWKNNHPVSLAPPTSTRAGPAATVNRSATAKS